MISSTNPSRPTKACKRLAASTSVSSLAAHCSRNSSGSLGISRTSVFIEDYILKRGATSWRPKSVSLNFHAEDFQNPLQLLVAEKPDLEQTLALTIAKLHFGAKAL